MVQKNLEHLLMMNFFLKLTNDIELQMKKHHWRICIRFICNGNLLLTPQMFDHYITFDPSLWWNNHYLVRTTKEHLSKISIKRKTVWFAGSNAKDISPFTKELANILKKKIKLI